MKKVLILSYYYPPSSFVGGQRTEYWANHLSNYGLYPIILTRHWNTNQKDLLEKSDQKELVIVKNENHEIHYLPLRPTLKNKISYKPSLSYLRKALVFLQFIFGRIHINLSSYKDFYSYSRNLITKDSDIKIVIASGRPFEMFQVGYFLKKTYDIKWIPDYRDEWNTHQNNDRNNNNVIRNFFSSIEEKSELKWTKNADYFLSVSKYWTDSIHDFIKIPGNVVMNGYHTYNPLPNRSKKDVFKIIYAGTIYASQPIELFIEAINQVIKINKYPELQIQVVFIGTEIEIHGHEKLRSLTKGKKQFKFLPRMDKEQLNMQISQADLLLLTCFENVKGWYPVKLFEYYATGKPILLMPSDNDVMEEFIRKVGCGYVCNNTESCVELLYDLIDKKNNGIKSNLPYDHDFAKQYSRKNQTKNLAELLNKH